MTDTVVTIIAVIACFVTIYPMWYVICMSISDPKAVNAGLVTFWPVGFTLDSYKIVCQDNEFWRSILNSVFYVVTGCVLMLFNTLTVGYVLTRRNLKGRKWLNYYLLIPMYFGGGMIPTFILYTKLGLYNNPLALILPGYSIWNMILMRTYLASIPLDLSDAAFIDGATNIQVLLKIYIPLAKPIIAVVLIYTIVGIWNSWFNASIYITDKQWQPAQLILRNILVSLQSGIVNPDNQAGITQDVQEQMAALAMSARQLRYTMIVIVTMPIVMVYPLFQKHFTKGIMLGSLKG